ncbi:vacuolar protein sorting-associated protein 18 dor isoform X2 [Lycorma delicatula]
MNLDDDDTPIFAKQTVNFKPTDKVTHLSVNNEMVVLTMTNNVLLRINLSKTSGAASDSKHAADSSKQQNSMVEEISIPRFTPPLRLIGLYLDPTGSHVLLSMATPRSSAVISGDQHYVPESSSPTELLYLNRASNKVKQTSKLRGHEVTAVGWNDACVRTDTTTRPILIGTSRGYIFEVELLGESDRMFQSNVEQYCRQVFDVGKGADGYHAVTGICFHRVPGTDKYFIIVVTSSRIYQFIGNISNSEERPLLQQIFNVYLSIPESFTAMPSDLKNAWIQFYYPKPKALPKHFGWLVRNGLFFAQIDPDGSNGDKNSVIAEQDLIPYPTPLVPPLSFVIMEFHVLFLYSDRVIGVCTLNSSLVFEDVYNESHGRLVSIQKDSVKGTIWVIAERAIFKYKVTREDRNVWQIFMEKGEYESAKYYAIDNPLQMDIIKVKQADEYFKKEKYEESALVYAETQSSFEEIALKFLQVWQIEALKIFLKKKLEKLKPSDKTQITMIVIWVVELCLNQLGNLRNEGKENTPEFEAVQADLDAFIALPQVTDSIRNNRCTVYDLMASHGDKHNLIRLTIANKDFERVIRHHCHKGDFSKALEVLTSQNNQKELYYTFVPTLIQFIPRPTVNALIEQRRSLNPSRLLPALVACQADDNMVSEIIRYLEFCIHSLNCQEQAIHNYLLSLYVRHKPDKLMHYLAMQGQEASMVNYDIRYALRLCREQGLTKACVQLSALLGLYETAVDLALTISVDLAKQTVSLLQADDELTKKLWLKIAQHVVREKNDIKTAMQFLQQCDLIKIEDILPFFSDFVTVDHFKDAICSSLQEYNQHIQDLKEEMEDATKSAEVIRKEIQSFRSRYTVINPSDMCNVCSIQLLLRPLYIFPCGHRFHADCLTAQLKLLLPQDITDKLNELIGKISSGSSSLNNSETSSTVNTTISGINREQIKNEIDSIVASECLYCGDYMINSIDQPFILDKDYDRIMKEWE